MNAALVCSKLCCITTWPAVFHLNAALLLLLDAQLCVLNKLLAYSEKRLDSRAPLPHISFLPGIHEIAHGAADTNGNYIIDFFALVTFEARNTGLS